MANKDSATVAIEKVVIKVGDREIPLTVLEAKELQEILNQTFGKEKTVYVPSAPIIIERPYYRPYAWWSVTPRWDTGTIYCSSTTTQLTS